VLSELVKERFMEKVLDVFGVVKSCGRGCAFLDLLFVSRLSRINTLEDT
jgi:hypothetical protein